MASLFDSPNDMHWQGTVDTYRRSDTRTYIGKILDERGDGNYTDNLTQKYTLELIGWGTKVFNAKVVVPNAGYNGTGNYVTYKVGDVVIGTAKEGQLDDFMITGSVRLNGDHRELEYEGKGLNFGDAPIGPRQRKAASNQVSLHPSRITKMDANTTIYGVNNSKNEFEDPTELGTLEDRLMKQPIPGIIKQQNREGIDMTYAYGGIVRVTDGNIIQVANGEKHNKCTKMLEQAKRHTKIARVFAAIGTFTSTNAQEEIDIDRLIEEDFTDTEVTFTDLQVAEFDSTNIQSFNPNATFSISENTPLFNPLTARPFATPVNRDNPSNTETEALQNSNGSSDVPIEEAGDQLSILDRIRKGFGALLRTPSYRSRKHQQLAELARKQAEECNRNGAAFQHSANLMANRFGNHLGGAGRPGTSSTGNSPNQLTGSVNPNNFSSRNTGNPKPPVEFIPASPINFISGPRINTPQRIFMHHTNGTMESAIGIFQRTQQIEPGKYATVSAHYIVGRDGRIVQMVPDNKVAYHAGPAGNNNSIGIENVATRTEKGLTLVQEEALIKLVRYLTSVYNIPNDKIFGHNTVSDTLCPTFIWPTQENLTQWVNTYIGT